MQEVSAAKIRWRCRRGMLELDFLLQKFFDNTFADLGLEEQQTFAKLLRCEDQDLWIWFTGQQETDRPEFIEIVKKIRAFRPG